jgi:acyl-CoA synthetase (AMP-forming)/AMP-acid ligase II
MQIGEMIRRAGRLFGELPALACEGQVMSFRDLDDSTDRLGNGMLRLGLSAGDRVAIMLPNGIDCIVAYYALAKAGLIRVPLNFRETPSEQRFKLDYVGARALIHAGDAPFDVDISLGPEDCARLIRDAPAGPCVMERGWEAPLRLGFTGGTTGQPKAVTLTTRGETAEIANFMIDLIPDVRCGDAMLHASPIAHASGAFFLPHLLRGARSVIMPKFDAGRFLDLAARERATCTFLVPTMLAMVLEELGGARPELALRRLCYGASPIAPTMLQRAIDSFGRVLAQTYGQAESPMVITCLKPEEHDRLGSCGRPYTFVEAQVVDEEERPVAVGEVGEIVCRGPQVMARYWERPEETERAFRGGWLHTGDVGRIDDAGYFYILDRKNDMLISGGYNVYPREVEDALLAIDGVVEAAVIGLPDETWGDRVHAVITARPGTDPTAVLAACAPRVAAFKRPRGIEIWPELPKSAAGKILRRKVRDRVVAERAQAAPTVAADPVNERIGHT